MKTIKVYYHGKRLKDMYPHASWFQVMKWKMYRFFRKLIIVTAMVGIAFSAFKSGAMTTAAETVYADREVVKEVEVVKNSPVLDRIAQCESGNVHYKNGQVIMRANTNGTVDIGKYQINTVWFAQATKLGLDLTKEEDNKKMAEWIYANRGTEDWYPSKSCWQK